LLPEYSILHGIKKINILINVATRPTSVLEQKKVHSAQQVVQQERKNFSDLYSVYAKLEDTNMVWTYGAKRHDPPSS
jgi:hypothetical protein